MQSHEDRFYACKIGPTVRLPVGAASIQTGALSPGFYRALSTVNCFLRQGADTSAATTADYFLPANMEAFFAIDSHIDELGGVVRGPGLQSPAPGSPALQGDDRYVNVIRASVDGFLYLTKVSALDSETTP